MKAGAVDYLVKPFEPRGDRRGGAPGARGAPVPLQPPLPRPRRATSPRRTRCSSGDGAAQPPHVGDEHPLRGRADPDLAARARRRPGDGAAPRRGSSSRRRPPRCASSTTPASAWSSRRTPASARSTAGAARCRSGPRPRGAPPLTGEPVHVARRRAATSVYLKGELLGPRGAALAALPAAARARRAASA